MVIKVLKIVEFELQFSFVYLKIPLFDVSSIEWSFLKLEIEYIESPCNWQNNWVMDC